MKARDTTIVVHDSDGNDVTKYEPIQKNLSFLANATAGLFETANAFPDISLGQYYEVTVTLKLRHPDDAA